MKITCKNNKGVFVEIDQKKFVKRPSVYALLKNNGKVLLCRNRGDNMLWFPGGAIESGESHEDALRRELAEETGLMNVRIGKLIKVVQNYFYYEPTDEAMDAQLHFYECFFTDETEVKQDNDIDDLEAHNFQWLSRDQINMDEFSDVREDIRAIFKMVF